MYPITCYLCGGEAKYKDLPDGQAIDCPACLFYSLTSRVILFHFEKESGSGYLEQSDKDQLIEYIKKKYDSQKRTYVPIDSEIIIEVTGAKSIKYR